MGYIVKKIIFLIFSISLGVSEKCVTTWVKFLNSVWLIVIIPNYSYTNDLKFFFPYLEYSFVILIKTNYVYQITCHNIILIFKIIKIGKKVISKIQMITLIL